MEYVQDLIKMIGKTQFNKFEQLLKENYLEFDGDGYIAYEYYTDYEDTEYIEDLIQKNYYRFKNIEYLTDFIIENYINNEDDYWSECFRYNIKECIYKLDITEEQKEELSDFMIDYFYIDYNQVLSEIKDVTIRINIDLCNQYGEGGYQFIKKYIPKQIYNYLRKQKDDYYYYEYTLSSVLNVNILDYYSIFKNKKRISLEGYFVLKDGFNGSYQSEYLLDDIKLNLKNVSLTNIHDVGYTIEEIGGEDEYICYLKKEV